LTHHLRRKASIGLIVSTALIASGCEPTAGGGDKAGGAGEPVVLTMASTAGGPGYSPAVDYLVRRVDEVSGGELRLNVVLSWGNFAPNAEEQVVRDVAAGKADVTTVGTRVFDTMGVTSFQALQAPLLIDSYALQDAFVKSDIPAQMLRWLDSLRVAGLAVIPGELAKPIAVAKPLLGAADWQGITFQAARSEVQTAAIGALGARPTDAAGPLNDELKSGEIQGFAKSLLTYQVNVYEQLAPYVTINVNLWPEMAVFVANPASLARLTDEQRGWLRKAAADTIAQPVSLVDFESQLVPKVCLAGAHLADATDADLAALRLAFEPVYADLVKDAETKAYIGQIEALKRSTTAEPGLTIPSGCTELASGGPATDPLFGTWATAKVSQSEWVKAFIAAGFSEVDAHRLFNGLGTGAEQYAQDFLTFDHGHFTEHQSGDGHELIVGNQGTYKVGPDGTFDLVTDGVETYTYVVTGDTLTLHLVKVVCPGDCGPPIGPTLYGSFPFTRSD
jgi:TRAP-type C4-dicarboxylate transport system substrate-binding protein